MAHFIIADNQDITRLGIEHILQHDAANTIDTAFSKSEIVALLKQEPASVVIMDYTNLDFT
jgi:DNA-binding NarL/FixJ family response regulator